MAQKFAEMNEVVARILIETREYAGRKKVPLTFRNGGIKLEGLALSVLRRPKITFGLSTWYDIDMYCLDVKVAKNRISVTYWDSPAALSGEILFKYIMEGIATLKKVDYEIGKYEAVRLKQERSWKAVLDKKFPPQSDRMLNIGKFVLKESRDRATQYFLNTTP